MTWTMHSHKIAHLDISPRNIVLYVHENYKNSYQLKLTSFKNCVTGELQQTPHSKLHSHSQVSAPEVVIHFRTKRAESDIASGNYFDAIKADVWSAGICLFIMCTGRLPFFQDGVPAGLKAVTSAVYLHTGILDTHPDTRDYISRILHDTPDRRPSTRWMRQKWCRITWGSETLL